MRIHGDFIRTARVVCAAVAIVTPSALNAQPRVDSALARAVATVERVDALRSSLAATFLQSGAPAGPEAFQQVCKPVGGSLKAAADSNGWQIRQVAIRNRNPANAADPEAARILRSFAGDPALLAVTLRTRVNGESGRRYLRRITVERSCLLCHGAKESRPDFVKAQFPQDKAHGFRVGDLRGAYSIFIPDAR